MTDNGLFTFHICPEDNCGALVEHSFFKKHQEGHKVDFTTPTPAPQEDGKEKGLYKKYIIQKASGKPLAEGFDAIVLRIDGGQYQNACRQGAWAFANAVEIQNKILSQDIKNRVTSYIEHKPIAPLSTSPSEKHTADLPQEADRVKVAKIIVGQLYAEKWDNLQPETRNIWLQRAGDILSALRKEPEKPHNIHDDVYFGKPDNHTCDNCKNTGTCSGEGMVNNCTNWRPRQSEKPGGEWLVKFLFSSGIEFSNDYTMGFNDGAKAQLKSDAKRLREEPNKIGLTAVMESLQKEASGLEAK
jgi:hypothetical protein